jgi:uncharacterized protein YceH (UPF0502 family)
MALDPGDVHHALRQLENRKLAKQVFSSRAQRYEHRAGAFFSLPQQQVALLGLLLLRGPQTVAELFTRSERLAKFADVDDVRHHLDRLAHREPALVVQLPRGPGQREDRYTHLLCGPVDVAAITERMAQRNEPGPSALEARVAALESEVAALREELAALRSARASGD